MSSLNDILDAPIFECYECNKKMRWSERCMVCLNCFDDCSCPKITFIKRKPKFHVAKTNQRMNNKSARCIGVELEIAKLKSQSPTLENELRKWGCSVVYDSSIPKSGFEITTAPASGDLFIKQIDKICGYLKNKGGIVDKKCGLHIHLDARDYDYNDLQRLVFLYALIEPAVFSMVPHHRRVSKYCKPCADKYNGLLSKSYDDAKSSIIKSTYGRLSTATRNKKYDLARRHALNIHSWFYRGTIECRLLEGTINAELIKNWGLLWVTIMDYAQNSTEASILKLKSKTSLNALLSIVKDKDLQTFIKQRKNQFINKRSK